MFCLLANPAGAQTFYYWDNNGLSTPTGGTWDLTTLYWSTSSAGVDSGSLVAFPAGGLPVFCAGSTGAGTITVTVDTANLSVNGVYNNNGTDGTACNLTLSGAGSLGLPSGMNTFYVTNGQSTTVSIPITDVSGNGSGGLQTGGSGTLNLNAANTYAGGTTLYSTALTYFNNNNAFGTGPIIPAHVGTPGYAALLSSGGALITLPNAFTISTANAGINLVQHGIPGKA